MCTVWDISALGLQQLDFSRQSLSDSDGSRLNIIFAALAWIEFKQDDNEEHANFPNTNIINYV